MDLDIVFGPEDQVDARVGDLTISTAQNGSAPEPFALFLASIGTCAGLYVSRFCRQRGIPTDRVSIRQRALRDPDTRMVTRIELDIRLPEEFPERYRGAVIRAAELCTVKKHLLQPPAIDILTSSATRGTAGDDGAPSESTG